MNGRAIILKLLTPFALSGRRSRRQGGCIEGFERTVFLDTIFFLRQAFAYVQTMADRSGRAVGKKTNSESKCVFLQVLRGALFLFAFGIWFPALAVVMTISDSGVYQLRGDLSGSTTDSIINITVSDVELDLGGYVVSQSSTGDGIEINEGLSNIVVHNGTIRGTTGTGVGVRVNTSTFGCSKIILEDLRIEDWASRAIYFQGTSSSVQVTDSEIKNCHITGNSGSPVLFINQCSRIYMSNCLIDNNSLTSGTLRVVELNTCDSCMLQKVDIRNNSASSGGFSSILLNASDNTVIVECRLLNNSAVGGLDNIYLFNADKNILRDCVIQGNSGTGGGRNYSLHLSGGSGSSNNLISNIKITTNSAEGSSGGVLDLTPSSKNVFMDCIVLKQSNSTAAPAFGFWADGSDSVYMRCEVADCTSTSGQVWGLLFNTSGSNLTAFDCTMTRNEGGGTDQGFVDSGTNNIFSKCLAYKNGTTLGNQLVTVNDSFNAHASGPWVNVGVV